MNWLKRFLTAWREPIGHCPCCRQGFRCHETENASVMPNDPFVNVGTGAIVTARDNANNRS